MWIIWLVPPDYSSSLKGVIAEVQAEAEPRILLCFFYPLFTLLLKLISEVNTLLRHENFEGWPEVLITLEGDVTEGKGKRVE